MGHFPPGLVYAGACPGWLLRMFTGCADRIVPCPYLAGSSLCRHSAS